MWRLKAKDEAEMTGWINVLRKHLKSYAAETISASSSPAEVAEESPLDTTQAHPLVKGPSRMALLKKEREENKVSLNFHVHTLARLKSRARRVQHKPIEATLTHMQTALIAHIIAQSKAGTMSAEEAAELTEMIEEADDENDLRALCLEANIEVEADSSSVAVLPPPGVEPEPELEPEHHEQGKEHQEPESSLAPESNQRDRSTTIDVSKAALVAHLAAKGDDGELTLEEIAELKEMVEEVQDRDTLVQMCEEEGVAIAR